MAEEVIQEQASIVEAMPEGAPQAMMQPDDDIRVVLLARLEMMQPEELQALDRLIDGQLARVILKLLPELKDVVDKMAEDRGTTGALANM